MLLMILILRNNVQQNLLLLKFVQQQEYMYCTSCACITSQLPLLPIATTTHGFTRLGRDPRPVWQDLKRLCAGSLYMDACGWDFYLERIDITLRDCKYCIALSFSPHGTAGGEVSDHTSAAEMLRMEDLEWERARAGLGA